MTNHDLAQLLFPDVTETIADLEIRYPTERKDSISQNTKPQVVVRIAPSPT